MLRSISCSAFSLPMRRGAGSRKCANALTSDYYYCYRGSCCCCTSTSRRFYSPVLPHLTVLPATLPELPFPSQDGVPPLFSPAQLHLHYQKHHKAYVEKLNALLAESSLSSLGVADSKDHTVESLMLAIHNDPKRKVLFNQAAQHFNHTFFWSSLCPAVPRSSSTSSSGHGGAGKGLDKGASAVENSGAGAGANALEAGALSLALSKAFQSVKGFMTSFETAGLSNFGSGWTWLCVDASIPGSPSLVIQNTSNADCPITSGLRPLLTVDVWEHAYYKDFENRRADYLKEFWTVVNWKKVEERYHAALADISALSS